MNFAEKLRALMDERGINGCQLARQAFCDRSLVYKYRQGKRDPSPEMAGRFDKVLDAGGELAALALRPPIAPGSAQLKGDGRILALEPVIRHPLADAEYVTHLREAIQQFAALETRYGGSDVLP